MVIIGNLDAGKVSSCAIIIMVAAIILSVAIPISLAVYFKKKKDCNVSAFVCGIFMYIIFNVVLLSSSHALIFNTSLGKTLDNNLWLYALYSGFMTAIFATLGKFVAFKCFIAKKLDNDNTSLMLGAGYGGVGMIWVLGFSMISTISLASLINDGSLNSFLAELENPEDVQSIELAAEELCNTSAIAYVLPIIERIASLAIEMCFAMWVWFSTKEKKNLFLLAVTVVAQMFISTCEIILKEKVGLNIYLLYALVVIFAAIIIFATRKIYMKYSKNYIGKNKITDEQYLM